MENDNQSIASLPMIKKLQNTEYLTFLLIGIGLLWPWNNILSATLFFQKKIFDETTIYAKIFTSSMMTVSTLSSLLFNVYLERRQHSYTARVRRGLIWQITVFICLVLISVISDKLWMMLDFLFVMVLISISAIATALTQNGIMAIANVFGPEFSQSVMVGQAVAGVIPSIILLIVSIGKSDDNDQTSSNVGIYFYFLTTSFVCIACMILFHLTKLGDKLIKSTETENPEVSLHPKQNIPFAVLYDRLKFLVLSIIVTFIITLIFPVFTAATFVSRLPMNNAQFIPLMFTVWNLGDLYGRVVANWPQFRDSNSTPWKIFVYSLSRIAFIPFYFFYTFRSRANSTSKSLLLDIGYILLQFLFGVTNGHIISMCFMKVPEFLTTDQEKEAAGGFTNIFASTGLAIGSIVSYIFVFLINAIKKQPTI